MPSRTDQRRIGRQAALLAVVLGAGWGCSQIIGADFDRPLQQGGTGGTGGQTPSAGSGGSGGGMSSANASGSSSATGASGSSSATGSGGSSSATSSSGSGTCIPQGGKDDTVCGPMGKDGNCDHVLGDCDTQRIYVGVRTSGDSTSCSDTASDIFMSDDKSEVESNDFQVISEFKTFKTKLPGTTELNRCTSGGAKNNKATISNLAPCTGGASGFRSLGFVSTVNAEGYEELQQLGIGPNTGILLDNSTYNEGCCHASATTPCAPLSTPVYVPKG